MPNWIYDGHESLAGVSGANPTLIPRNLAASAVNRWFRYDNNNPRPGFRNIVLEYVDDTTGNNRKLLEAGNIQGATFYNSYPSFATSYIVVSVAGAIFTIEIVGRKGYVRKLFEGNDPVFTHAWFAQAFEWLIIQDGSAKPILWNGTDPARRAADGEVPTGSVMAFIHGRLAVASSDGTNQIAVGDIVYGNDATTTNDVIKFTETQYWASGGAFGVPVYVGNISGLFAMPYLDTGTGQNELVVLGTEGAVSIDLSKPRATWLDTSILRISLIGGGCVSTHSLAALNGELFFRSSEGIRAFRNARMEYQDSWKQTPISTDVRRWIDYDAPVYLQYCSQTAWNNMLFCTCQPRIAAANNAFAGHHRFHLGFVVLDAAPESNTLRNGASIWNGMWTGIRPVCFVTGRVRGAQCCFAFSYDCDGRNRLYEVTQGDTDDIVDDTTHKIRSSYITGNLGVIERVSNNFELKKLAGGTLELSDIREEVQIDVAYRPDNSPCYLAFDSFKVGCDCVLGDCGEMFTLPTQARKNFASPDAKVCAPGMNGKAVSLNHLQVKIAMEGFARVERMRVKMDAQKHEDVVECLPANCVPVQCCENDYYCIVSGEGAPPAVPVIPRPSDINDFIATATVTVPCPTGTQGSSVTRTSTATSTISFEDAMFKAREQARIQANAALRCTNCTPEVAIDFTANNNTTDLSTFFSASAYSPSYNAHPWRLIETVTEIEYATGYVDEDGTLVIVWSLPGYTTFFDETTHEFVDGGLTDASMSLQLGCPNNGSPTWPSTPDYLSP